MTARFPYIDVPNELLCVVGDYDEETRSYHAYGEESQVGYWYEALNKCVRGVVPSSGVSMFVPVSRAAIHNRIKDGRFTVFYFHSKPATNGLFRNKKEARESAYIYVPVSECKAWAEVVKDKMLRLGHISDDEVQAERPSWYVSFYEWLDPDGIRSEYEAEGHEQAKLEALEREQYEREEGELKKDE
jgi:hypothetical protein